MIDLSSFMASYAGSVKGDQSVSMAIQQALTSYMLPASSYSPAFCADMVFFDLLSCKTAKDIQDKTACALCLCTQVAEHGIQQMDGVMQKNPS